MKCQECMRIEWSIGKSVTDRKNINSEIFENTKMSMLEKKGSQLFWRPKE